MPTSWIINRKWTKNTTTEACPRHVEHRRMDHSAVNSLFNNGEKEMLTMLEISYTFQEGERWLLP